MLTPGVRVSRSSNLRPRMGVVPIAFSLRVVLDSVLRVSTVAVPVTVTVSVTLASFMVGLSVTVWPTETFTCSCTSVAKPASVKVTV